MSIGLSKYIDVCMCVFPSARIQIFPPYIMFDILEGFLLSLIFSFCCKNSSFLSHSFTHANKLDVKWNVQKGKLTIHFPQTESSNMKQKQYHKSMRKTLDILAFNWNVAK